MEMVAVNHHVGEGGIGTILRGTKSKTASAKLAAATRAVPLSQLLPSPESQPVGVLKIDVEGNELGVLRSLLTALDEQNERVVENVIIEYGPPSRWRAVTDGETIYTVASVMASLRDRGYGVRIFAVLCHERVSSTPVSVRQAGKVFENSWRGRRGRLVCPERDGQL